MHLGKIPHLVVNIVGLKAGWLACVLGAANDQPHIGVIVVALVAGVHLFFADYPLAELKLLAIVAVLGLAWDSVLVQLGLMLYPSGNFLPGLAPYWIIAMWVLFATALNTTLSWLKNRWVLAAVFGGFGGAMAFFGGHKLGGVQIPDLALGIAAQGVGWAFIMPTLMWLTKHFNGVVNTAATPASARVISDV